MCHHLSNVLQILLKILNEQSHEIFNPFIASNIFLRATVSHPKAFSHSFNFEFAEIFEFEFDSEKSMTLRVEQISEDNPSYAWLQGLLAV
jgi:hypothetical protein